MQIEFIKMVQFSLLVKAGDRLREFNFRQLRDPGEPRFSVNVCDERGNRIVFGMQKKEDNWRIPDNDLPEWVLRNEEGIGLAVDEELRKWQVPGQGLRG